MTDFVQVAIDYAEKALADKKRKSHGLLIQQAAKRFLDDLERAKTDECGFYFDENHANHACAFIELLPHVEGVWENPNIVLHPSQVFFVAQLFGFRKKESGNRRFTSALYAVARKAGKSTLSAAILLYCLCCEDEPGAQVISAATTFDQAAIIWRVAKAMTDKTSALREAYGLQTWAKAITRLEQGANFKPLHAKASTQDGLNPSHVGLDEIHAHKTADLLNVLQSAAGARANPLWLFTTTEGYANAGPWAEIRQFARQLLAGVYGTDADHYLAVFFAVDNENKTLGIKADDEFDESKWIKANPLIDVNPHLLDAIRREAVEAKQMPSKLAEFRIKRLNRPASSADGFIDLTKWAECGGKVDLEWLEGHPCTAAFDLSSTRDMTSWRLVWKVDGIWYTWGRRWTPADSVYQRTERGTVPYAGWVEAGLVTQTAGDAVDYAVIEEAILADFYRFKPSVIAFDSWNAQDLSNRLMNEELPLVEFVQGPRSYHPPMQELERAYIAKQLAHGGDPVLFWQASNLVARRDQNLNMAPDKRKSADKIDDMAALLMAMGVYMTESPKEVEYVLG